MVYIRKKPLNVETTNVVKSSLIDITDVPFSRPTYVVFLSKRVDVHSWPQLFYQVVSLLIDKHPKYAEELCVQKGTGVRNIKDKLRSPLQIKNLNVWIERNNNTENICRNINNVVKYSGFIKTFECGYHKEKRNEKNKVQK